jgi:primosomal protein N' (replication factor Y)
VLGSATPSLESFHNAQSDKYRYLSLPSRIGERSLAAAELIDMRAEFARHKKPAVFSEQVLAAIAETKAKGEQSIVLLNRRGYSSFILCRSCGESIMCPNCEVTLTYHRGDQTPDLSLLQSSSSVRLRNVPFAQASTSITSAKARNRLKRCCASVFPSCALVASIAIRNHVAANSKKLCWTLKKAIWICWLGTQMLAKGHDFPNVTFVGVISVDAGLALPDFRAAERTFQLVTQVAGRAGRGDRPGNVLIQTTHPHHYALRHAVAQDYLGFYNEEIRHRRNHQYPPICRAGSVTHRHSDANRAFEIAQQLRKALVEVTPSDLAASLVPRRRRSRDSGMCFVFTCL